MGYKVDDPAQGHTYTSAVRRLAHRALKDPTLDLPDDEVKVSMYMYCK